MYKSGDTLLILLAYVDDILIIGDNSTIVSKLASDLNCNFALKGLSSLHFFLGVEAFRDTTGLYLTNSNQINYWLDKMNKDGWS